MLKESAGVSKSNVPINVFEQYFKSVNNPDDRVFVPDDDIIYFIERYENDEFCSLFVELNTSFSFDEL